MDISIVIPNYNGANYILDSIASIYDQIENKKEIIVIDNDSQDGSVVLIKEKYPDISLIINDRNLGFASAVNQGIKYSCSEYIILLNNDAFAQQNFVRHLFNCIDADRGIFSVASQMLSYSNPSIIDNAGDQLSLMGWAFKTGDGDSSDLYEKDRIIFSSCAGGAIYRREILDRISYFDDMFFAYLEDVDLGFRANIFGYKNVYCPKAKVLHIGSATSGNNRHNSFKVRLSARNNVYLVLKNIPIVMLILNAPFLIAGFLIKALYFRRLGFGAIYIEGLIEAFKTIKSIKRIKYKMENTMNYIRIEYMMTKSTIYFLKEALLRFLK
ncbi:glycosyltransferase family 2 protein [Brevibacillus sp. Leaf182]|uniref:glycosyltransferase family 2 protein n=1 Tax=Brevibacillus sp. Leaf182 TaxID=1736290 RepID=UPI000B2251EB|nr:glycosyltransferase family 2 protein [Brevibacillus sp. Leaf182]